MPSHEAGSAVRYLFLLGRVLYGGFLLLNAYHHFSGVNAMAPYAASRGIPAPKLAVLGSGVLLLLGGLSILFGIKPTIGILCVVLFLLPVTLTMHNYWADKEPQARQSNQIQFHKNVALLGAALMFLAIAEPWWLSLGH
jgi:putative oxidoreductase